MAITSGNVDVTLPELPGERSPAHWAYCVMLSVVSGVISSLGWQKYFFEAEASGFIQLCGNQITRALSWTVGDPVTLPLVEEMERVVNFSILSLPLHPQKVTETKQRRRSCQYSAQRRCFSSSSLTILYRIPITLRASSIL